MEPGFYWARPVGERMWRPVKIARATNNKAMVFRCEHSNGEWPSVWEFGPRIPDYKPEDAPNE